MFERDEAVQLKKVCEALPTPVKCTYYQAEEGDFSRKLKSFVDELGLLSEGKVRVVTRRPDPGMDILPCFRMGGEGHSGIVYAAVPLGHQFPPFVNGLRMIGEKGRPLPQDKPAPAVSPAELQLLVSEHCPRCPVVAEAVLSLSNRYSSISSFIVDAAQFPDITQRYGIKSVPATILDRRLVLIGNISADRILELLGIRGTPQFEMEVVQSLIDTGRIPDAAECLDQDAGREVILALIQHPDFSKRLSGLVVVETALTRNPDAVRALVPAFVQMLTHDDSRIRGDIADLLGRTGDPKVIPQLEPLVSDPDPDVAEAAAEAIEELRKGQSNQGD
jgi:alkyl hydroperoxide reductase subunit F